MSKRKNQIQQELAILKIDLKNNTMKNTEEIKERLEYLREELRQERISYGELVELQSLAEHIDSDDVELLQVAHICKNWKKQE